MPTARPVDEFTLAYERTGAGSGAPAVVCLHGWPGDRRDWREVAPRLDPFFDVVVPDLRGFGESDKHPGDPVQLYSAEAQVRSVLGLLDELGLETAIVAGYDVGGRVAQALARTAPERVRALVVAPPMPGVGERVLAADMVPEFWYQSFHRLELPETLIDGRPDAVRAYLAHFWSHWSGPGFDADRDADLDHLVDVYGPPGAFAASIAWYRAGAGTFALARGESPPAPEDRIAAPTTVLWPAEDPLFPRAWGDRVDEWFARAVIYDLPDTGHFVPLEAPERFALAISDAAAA